MRPDEIVENRRQPITGQTRIWVNFSFCFSSLYFFFSAIVAVAVSRLDAAAAFLITGNGQIQFTKHDGKSICRQRRRIFFLQIYASAQL